MAFFVVLSFWQVEYFELSTEPTIANYRDVFANYWHVMGFTVVLATSTALLTTVLGFVFSFLARFRAGEWAQAAALHRADHAVRRLSDEDLCLEDDPRQ